MITKRQQSGFTLIESLVSFLIIVLGIVGVGALQSAAISSTKIASDRSVAAIHTSALLSRMKGNSAFWQTVPATFDIVIDAAGVITDVGAGSDGAALDAESTDCSSGVCQPIQTAAYNLKTWAQSGSSVGAGGGFSDRLPAAGARVRRIGNDFPVMIEVTLAWNEQRSASGLTMAGSFYSASGTTANSQRNFNHVIRSRP